MPYLSPPTLTRHEVESLLAVTRVHARDHVIIAIALGTSLRLGEVVGLNVGDVCLAEGTRADRSPIESRAVTATGLCGALSIGVGS